MSTERTMASVILATVVFTLAWSPAGQPAEKLTRITVAYSAISYDQLPAWIAKETGLFTKNGLDVQLVYFTGGTTAAMALVSGDVRSPRMPGRGCQRLSRGSDPVFVAEAPSHSIGGSWAVRDQDYRATKRRLGRHQ
jgi:hypothetical protein